MVRPGATSPGRGNGGSASPSTCPSAIKIGPMAIAPIAPSNRTRNTRGPRKSWRLRQYTSAADVPRTSAAQRAMSACSPNSVKMRNNTRLGRVALATTGGQQRELVDEEHRRHRDQTQGQASREPGRVA